MQIWHKILKKKKTIKKTAIIISNDFVVRLICKCIIPCLECTKLPQQKWPGHGIWVFPLQTLFSCSSESMIRWQTWAPPPAWRSPRALSNPWQLLPNSALQAKSQRGNCGCLWAYMCLCCKGVGRSTRCAYMTYASYSLWLCSTDTLLQVTYRCRTLVRHRHSPDTCPTQIKSVLFLSGHFPLGHSGPF